MRALKVISGPPCIKSFLKMCQISPLIATDELFTEAAMKALIFTDSLGMIGTTVTNVDVETNQPNAQGCVRMSMMAAPGRTIVGQKRVWETIASKCLGQRVFDRRGLLAGKRLQTKVEAGVII
jgi:hypothetical protein